MKFLNFCLLLGLNFFEIYAGPIETIIEVYRCDDRSSSTCTLSNVIFDDQDSGRFLPKSNNPQGVTKVKIVSSKIPTLISDICETFPNLEILEINGVSMEVIKTGALDGCTKLKEIYLQDNKLKNLEKNTFKQNKFLTKIILNNNDLKTIHKELFNGLYHLKWIDLCSNQLSRLPAKTFAGLESMENLEIRNNPLLSLEIEELKHQMPNLRYVLLRDLDLSCDRMREVDKFCESNSIDYFTRSDYSDYHSESADSYIRSRSYAVTNVNNFECLSNEQHEREVLLRETLPTLLNRNGSASDEIELRTNFDAIKDEYDKKFEEIANKAQSTESTYLMKIFEAQTFMLKLLKDKLESQDAKMELLETQLRKIINGSNNVD